MFLFEPFAEVVQQQSQMQQVLFPQLAIGLADDRLVLFEVGTDPHRLQGVLVDGVLVVLVELQQPTSMSKTGDDFFQRPHLMEDLQDIAEFARVGEQSHKLQRCRLVDSKFPVEHRAANRQPRLVLNRLVMQRRQLHQPEDLL